MTKDEVLARLETATPELILVGVAAIVAQPDYIENATDGYRMQYTIEYIVSRGKKGDLQSSHLAEVAMAAMDAFMSAPLNPSPRNEPTVQ